MDILDLRMLEEHQVIFFINDKPRGRITTSRGIRQRHPLSPFLFLLVGDVLGAFVLKLYENGLYEGFLVGKEKIHAPFHQYADDTPLLQTW